MTYAIIDPASVGRAARDMTRLSKEIVELTIEAANGLAAPEDGARIEQAALQFKDLADRSAVYVKAVLKQAEEKAKAAAEKEAAEKAKKQSEEENKPAEEEKK